MTVAITSVLNFEEERNENAEAPSKMREEQQPQPDMEEEKMQQLRSKAAQLLLREEWKESVQAYSHFIALCQDHISQSHQLHDPDHLSKLHKSLCLAFSNRAQARFRLRDFSQALNDCDEALKFEGTHFKTLLCKGKILLNLNRYNVALDCFKSALLDPQASINSESLNGYLEKCKKLEFLSRTGNFDISDWVVNGFRGKSPELAEFIGAVEIKKSEISGRGLFATKNIDCGTLLLVTKAIATERGILPESKNDDLAENAKLVMWKDLINKVLKSALQCRKTYHLICTLSNGEEEDALQVPDISLYRPEAEESCFPDENVDMGKILSVLDVNSLVEDANSAKVLGKNSDYHGVGFWILASFINHSCSPNARRLHIGDHLIVHASRDVKAGEEITFTYFDMLLPLNTRNEMARTWGFQCNCKRCKFEEGMCNKQGMREIEMGLQREVDMGEVVYCLEESMRRWMARGKEKGYLRASFWVAYSKVFNSEKARKRWGMRIPTLEVAVDSVVDAVGSDERVLNVLVEGLKKSRGNGGGSGGDCVGVVMDKTMKLGRGIYGKVVKKQAMRSLLELGVHEQS